MKIKFEKINMKFVIAVGIGLILLITLIFILFRTNLIIDRNKNDNKPGQATTPKTNTNTNINSNTNIIDDDPKVELSVSEEAKNRTKPYDKLNVEEKKYIIQENMMAFIEKEKDGKKNCEYKEKQKQSGCRLPVQSYIDYTKDPLIGVIVKGCTGDVNAYYHQDTKEWEYDFSAVTCK